MNPDNLFSLSDHLDRLSKDYAPLEVLAGTVNFEFVRVWLVEGLGWFLRVSSLFQKYLSDIYANDA